MTAHGPQFSRIHSTCRALAHPYRRGMLEIAAIRPATLMRMYEFLPAKTQTLSYHLNVLLESGVLRCSMGWGREFTYEPNAGRLEQLQCYIDSCLMPAHKLEQRGRIVCNFGEGEFEACRAALQRWDEEHVKNRAPSRPWADTLPPAIPRDAAAAPAIPRDESAASAIPRDAAAAPAPESAGDPEPPHPPLSEAALLRLMAE